MLVRVFLANPLIACCGFWLADSSVFLAELSHWSGLFKTRDWRFFVKLGVDYPVLDLKAPFFPMFKV